MIPGPAYNFFYFRNVANRGYTRVMTIIKDILLKQGYFVLAHLVKGNSFSLYFSGNFYFMRGILPFQPSFMRQPIAAMHQFWFYDGLSQYIAKRVENFKNQFMSAVTYEHFMLTLSQGPLQIVQTTLVFWNENCLNCILVRNPNFKIKTRKDRKRKPMIIMMIN